MLALVGSVPDPRRVRVSSIRLSRADAAEVRELATTALGSRSANDFMKRAALLHTDVVPAGQLLSYLH